jgi:hypothetical protein
VLCRRQLQRDEGDEDDDRVAHDVLQFEAGSADMNGDTRLPRGRQQDRRDDARRPGLAPLQLVSTTGSDQVYFASVDTLHVVPAGWRPSILIITHLNPSARVTSVSQKMLLRQNWSRGQVEARVANMLPCLIGMAACVP